MENLDSLSLSSIYKLKKTDRDIFQELMPYKVKEVLLLATLYDSYSIVREGQFTDKIFGEFLQLNLYAYPRFTSVNSEQDAVRMIKSRDFDLVIIMMGVDKNIPVRAAEALYKIKPQVPILLLVNNNGDLRYFQTSSTKIESLPVPFPGSAFVEIVTRMAFSLSNLSSASLWAFISISRLSRLLKSNAPPSGLLTSTPSISTRVWLAWAPRR